MNVQFNSYTAGYEWLSNFFEATIDYAGRDWMTVEHAYRAMKTVDEGQRDAIMLAPTASKAKRIGKHVDIRPDWLSIRVDVMRELTRCKYSQHNWLSDRLIATGDATLYHLAPWDRFWGVDDQLRGENQLGRILMAERLRCATAPAAEL